MREYEIETPGGTITVQLDDESAKERGLKAKAERKTANKSKTVENKAVESEEPAPRTAATKKAEVTQKAWQRKK